LVRAAALERLGWRKDGRMIFRPITEHPAGPSSEELRATALQSAILLRDCSFRTQSSEPERRACRTLMRGQALKWRDPSISAW
jgi:hypothetical protein